MPALAQTNPTDIPGSARLSVPSGLARRALWAWALRSRPRPRHRLRDIRLSPADAFVEAGKLFRRP